MKYITFTDANDVMFNLELDKKMYKIRMLWNPMGFWTLSLWTLNKKPVLTNVRIIPNVPLTMTKHCYDIPSGDFCVLSKLEELERDSFVDGEAYLVYLENSEI